jgi:hypothetical protein
MAGNIISYYTDITDMTTVLDSLEKQRRGFINISLTEWSNSTVPKIKTGSVVNNDGSLFEFDSDTIVAGSPSDGAVWIKLVVSTGALPSDTTVIPTWTNITPAWNDEKQGYYEGASERVIAGATKSGSSYTDKYILHDRESFYLRRYGTGNIEVISGYSGNFTTNNVVTGNITTANIATINSRDYSKTFSLTANPASSLVFTTEVMSTVRLFMQAPAPVTWDGFLKVYDGATYQLINTVTFSAVNPAAISKVFVIGPGQYEISATGTAGYNVELEFIGCFGLDDNTQSNVVTIIP